MAQLKAGQQLQADQTLAVRETRAASLRRTFARGSWFANRLRVENLGGVVRDGRLHHPTWNGALVNLAVTRSLGDACVPFLLEFIVRSLNNRFCAGSSSAWSTREVRAVG